MLTEKVALSISQSLGGTLNNAVPSSVSVRSPQEMKADGDAFARALGLGDSGSLFNPLKSLDAQRTQYERESIKIAKKKMPSRAEMTGLLAAQVNLGTNLSMTTKLLGQVTKAMTALTNQQ